MSARSILTNFQIFFWYLRYISKVCEYVLTWDEGAVLPYWTSWMDIFVLVGHTRLSTWPSHAACWYVNKVRDNMAKGSCRYTLYWLYPTCIPQLQRKVVQHIKSLTEKEAAIFLARLIPHHQFLQQFSQP